MKNFNLKAFSAFSMGLVAVGTAEAQVFSQVIRSDQVEYFIGGTRAAVTRPIANTEEDALYQVERYGRARSRFDAKIPLKNSRYEVTLKFAEIFKSYRGKRKFHVDIEGKRVLTEFDIFVASGGKDRAIDKMYVVDVLDGYLDISFLAGSVDNAKISAIKIVEKPNRAPVITSIANQVMNVFDSKTVAISASDPDGDAIQFSAASVLPAYAQLRDNGNGTASLVLNPRDSDAGVKTISIRAKDSRGLSVQKSFSVTVNALSGNGVQTARPRGSVAGVNLGFYEYLPPGYSSGESFPVVIFFHGIGERGNGLMQPTLGTNADGTTYVKEKALTAVLVNGPPKLIKNGKNLPAIVISPQLPLSRGSWAIDVTGPFVDYILNHYRVNRDRVYITGLSLGGGGAWIYSKMNPHVVAAVVPVCGYDGNTDIANLIGKPVWAFHHEVDKVVAYSRTTSKMKILTGIDPELNRPQDNYSPGYTASFDATKKAWVWVKESLTTPAVPPAANKQIMTTYEGSSHNSWGKAYNDQAMWDWLFQQSK